MTQADEQNLRTDDRGNGSAAGLSVRETLALTSDGPADEKLSAGANDANRPGKPDKSGKNGSLLQAAMKRHAEVAELLRRPSESLKDADFVHDLRVAARRLGEVARLLSLREFLDKPTGKAVEASLKTLRRSMGELRDGDVAREHLLKWKMPAALKHMAGELAEQLAENREKLEKTAGEQMRCASVTGAMVVLAQVLEDRSKAENIAEVEREVRAGIQGQLKKREKQMRRQFGRATRKQTPQSLHDARITVKKLRYVLELAQEAGQEKDGKPKMKFLKHLQKLLGEHHDVHVIEATLRQHLDRLRKPTPKGLNAGWRKWHAQMERDQAKRAAEFFAQSYQWMNA